MDWSPVISFDRRGRNDWGISSSNDIKCQCISWCTLDTGTIHHFERQRFVAIVIFGRCINKLIIVDDWNRNHLIWLHVCPVQGKRAINRKVDNDYGRLTITRIGITECAKVCKFECLGCIFRNCCSVISRWRWIILTHKNNIIQVQGWRVCIIRNIDSSKAQSVITWWIKGNVSRQGFLCREYLFITRSSRGNRLVISKFCRINRCKRIITIDFWNWIEGSIIEVTIVARDKTPVKRNPYVAREILQILIDSCARMDI